MAPRVREKDYESRILKMLRSNVRGLTISQIASRLKINRNSTAKYLEILTASGHVECRMIGTARVYTSAHRVPVTALLDFSNDLVCTIDEESRFVYMNNAFLKFLRIEENQVRGRTIGEVLEYLPQFSDLLGQFSELEERKESVEEKEVKLQDRTIHLRLKSIPTLFEDGSRGTTIVMEDVTQEREYIRSLEFIARTSTELANMPDSENIYQYIVDKIGELVPGSIIVANSVDTESGRIVCRAIGGDRNLYKWISEENEFDIIGIPLKIEQAPEALPVLQANTLLEGPGSLYEAVFHMYPKDVCDRIEEQYSLGRDYVMGCVCREGLYGAVFIKLRRGMELQNKELVEAFIRQSALALQRRFMKEKVRRLEEKLQGAGLRAEHISSP